MQWNRSAAGPPLHGSAQLLSEQLKVTDSNRAGAGGMRRRRDVPAEPPAAGSMVRGRHVCESHRALVSVVCVCSQCNLDVAGGGGFHRYTRRLEDEGGVGTQASFV